MLPAITGNVAHAAASQFPVAIDYPSALALRQMALVQDELPKYLLAPEVTCIARCFWPHCGTPGRALTKP